MSEATITITKKEYIELVSNSLNYGVLLNVLYQGASFNLYKGGLEFDDSAINHFLCALDTKRYYTTKNLREDEAKEEMERIKNEYGINKDNR